MSTSANAEYTATADIPAIVNELRETFYSGKTKDVAWRKDQLKRITYMIKDNETRLCEAMQADLGRSFNESRLGEIYGIINDAVYTVAHVEEWAKPEVPAVPLQNRILKPRIYKEPKGVALIIGTWNYPVSLVVQPLIGAIAAGCPALLKLSEVAPNSAKLLKEMVEASLDQSAVRVVLGEVPQTTKLLEEPWGHIFYTGNSKIARIIAGAAAKTLTPTTLELGGKSPVIIDPDLEKIDVAAKRILWAKSVNCGQICIAPDYVVVPEKSQAALISALQKHQKEFFPEQSLAKTDYPRIVSDNHHKRLTTALDKTSGEIVSGGERNEKDRLLGVTVVKDVKWDDELMQNEIFGPILPIIPVKSIDEALGRMKGATPLAMYIFTESKKFSDKVLSKTSSGAALVNDLLLHFTMEGLPFGGVGESGTGSCHGKYSFDCFTHERASYTLPFWAEFLFGARYAPYTDKKNAQLQSTSLKKINFPRPGKTVAPLRSTSPFSSALKYAVLALAVGLLARRWSWLVSIVPAYRLVRVS